MDERALEAYLQRHIPLARAMQVTARRVTPDSVELLLPLTPNLNHRDTAFGGSIAAAAILAAWSLVSVRLAREAVHARLVIQRQEVEYDRPVETDFSARAYLEEPAAWERFVHTLRRRGRARLSVACEIAAAGACAARFEGAFVALLSPGKPPI
ncbi:MAG: YiiD C-terminal domain-containing protein [Gammaproteobacteria bacterium]|nr:YiiD C-terminal domain-containing protein [Gammaproteobacteria bacterium]